MYDKIHKEQFEKLSETMNGLHSILDDMKTSQKMMVRSMEITDIGIQAVEQLTTLMKEYFDAWVAHYKNADGGNVEEGKIHVINNEMMDVEKFMEELQKQISPTEEDEDDR